MSQALDVLDYLYYWKFLQEIYYLLMSKESLVFSTSSFL